MLFQFYLMLASPSSLTLAVRVMFFELCVHDGQAPVRRAMLSGDSSYYLPAVPIKDIFHKLYDTI